MCWRCSLTWRKQRVPCSEGPIADESNGTPRPLLERRPQQVQRQQPGYRHPDQDGNELAQISRPLVASTGRLETVVISPRGVNAAG